MWHNHPKVRLCAEALTRGEVLAYPTEAVWGLGCDPFNVSAVKRVLALKNRDWEKGLILVAGTIEQFDFLLHDLPPEQRQTLLTSWPGHITWLVPHHNRVPKIVSGRHPSVALRVSGHPVVGAICESFGGPIVSTSANPQGLAPAKSVLMARRYFKAPDMCFAPGQIGQESAPSSIRDLATGKTIR